MIFSFPESAHHFLKVDKHVQVSKSTGNDRKRKKSMKFCCGLNFLTPTFAARGRSDFLAEIVGRAAGTVLPGFFGPIHVHAFYVFHATRNISLLKPYI